MAAPRSALALIVLVLAVVAVTEGRFARILINECVRGTYALMGTTKLQWELQTETIVRV